MPKDSNRHEKVGDAKSEKLRILKNIFVISLAFMLHFSSYEGMANLQSSINAENNLGTNALGSIYVTIFLSCIFLPTFMIRRLTVKWTIVSCMLCYLPFLASQLYPTYATLIPASILLGLGAGPMMAAQSTYITQLGHIYALITNQHVSGVIVQFFGFFILAWQTSDLWGNLISSLVLSNDEPGDSNGNNSINEAELVTCGAAFCTEDAKFLQRPTDREILKLTVIYLGLVIVGILIITIFLDSLRRYGEKRKGSTSDNTGFNLLLSTLKQLIKPKQLLLIPITIWIGMEESFVGADFTRSYVTCALGVDYIGYVMICFGIVAGIFSVLFGSIMKYIGRIPIIVLGAIVHLTIVTYMLFWRPNPSYVIVFFVMSGLWGVGDAVWQTQINGFYGILFRQNKEAAFSNYCLWESVGFAIGYACNTLVCTETKLYMLLAVLSLGLIGYTIVEIEYVQKQEEIEEIHSTIQSNISSFTKIAFMSYVLHPSPNINSSNPDSKENDELKDDIVIKKENYEQPQNSKK